MRIAAATTRAARIRNRCFESIGDGSLGSIGARRRISLSVVDAAPE
jgi:hypothetical protein